VAALVVSSCAAQGIIDGESRRLEIAIGNSDEYASAILTVKDPSASAQQLPQLQEHDHTRITSILDTTRQMIDTSRELVQNERTLSQGQKMLAQANNLFREVKADILRHHATPNSSVRGFDGTAATNTDDEERRDLLRKKYSEHDIAAVKENDERSLFMTQDISRKVYETMISFPECLEKLFQNCLDTINSEIAEVGLSTIEVVVHEKRNANQEGYNKVVIVTNELADSVRGRTGNGIVDYPFLWNDVVTGPRSLGVDGKWNCLNMTPEDCCETIKSGVPNPDTNGNNMECHIFVPFGGVGNPRRNDRVFITLSPDGRIHEPPIIQ